MDVDLSMTKKDGTAITANTLVAPSMAAGLSFIQRITLQFNNTTIAELVENNI